MKRTTHLFIRLVSVVLMLSLLSFGLVPTSANAVNVSCVEYSGSNQLSSYHNRWASTVKSHLVNVNGGLMRFQANATNSGYVAEYFDSTYQLTNTITIPTELPVYGGFYASGSNYYILSGQNNPDEDANVECFRITKYDLNWKRLGATGLSDCNTTIPFDAGSARFAMSGKYLIIRTAHEMYMADDGYNHQANVTIQVDTETMTITDSFCGVMNKNYGYISHSFNQFVHVENNKIVAVDHGDAHPRSIVLLQYQTDLSGGTFMPSYYDRCIATDLLAFPGGYGDNTTNASIGGFEISDSSYLVAYNYVVNYDESADYWTEAEATRNVFIASMNKETSAVTLKQITSYADGDITASVPHLVKLTNNSFLLLWAQGDTVYYTKLNAAGDPVGQIYSMDNTALSDCVPVVSGGKAIWYVWNNNLVTIYEIDLTDLTKTRQTELEYGHDMTVLSYPTAAGGECTMKCEECGFTKTGVTPSALTLWWRDKTTNNSYYSRPQQKAFDVGDKLYLWNSTSADDVQLAQCDITVSDPSGVSTSWISDHECCFTFTTPGTYQITIACTYNPLLTKTYTFTVAHTYENGVCTGCGAAEPVKLPVLEPTGATLSLEGEVMYKVYFTVDDPSSIKSMGMLTFNSQPANGNIENADEVISKVELVNGTYIASSNGIPAKKLGDEIYICLYAQLQDGTYVYSRVIKYSGKIYADYMLDYRSDDPALQKVVVAMLNYGAEAQTFFGYKTDSLMNADLTESEKNMIVDYNSTLVPSRALPDAGKTGNFPKSEQFSYRSASMVLEGALAINYRFVPSSTPDSGLTLYYWTEDTYNSVDALSMANVDGQMTMEQDASGYYTATYDGLAAKQMGDVIYIAAVYESNGETHTTGVIAYSLYTYCNDAVTYKQPSAEIAKAAAVYGYYAESYFGN